MDKLKEMQSRLMIALAVFPAFLLATACGSGSNASQATASADPSAPQAVSFEIQVSPALTPNFDPSIHDYVINCASSSEVQFTASMPAGGPIAYFGPNEGPGATWPYPGYFQKTAYFQKTIALNPGERFRFVIGHGSSEYSVRCLPQDFPPLSVSVNGTREAEWYLFAPSLIFNPTTKTSSYVIIADANGTPIWWKSEPDGIAIDAKILGANQITWTIQTNQPVAQYVIRDFSGRVINTIGSDLNDHDLQSTPNGTLLAIRDVARVCPPDCADMSPWGGSSQMSILDQEIVELDKSSNVLWTWRTRDHVGLSESGAAGWFPGVGYDIIHMNAVEPDGTDAVLFSARHLNAIYRISKSTGAIDWKIGGTIRPESLVVIGDIRPTAIGAGGQSLSGQHDVRKLADGTISVHDNGTNVNRPPSIVRYKIDTAARTASVVEQLEDKSDTASICCGSARQLPGGHWLVQWGGLPYMAELDADGNSVLTIKYNMGPQFSYRAVPILPGTVDGTLLRVGMDAVSKLIH
ncbi:MAG TPA: aryl-sulfate sulfotransferase [Steroidobacteraceae bacterium]|jgi:hypothetical protein